MPEIPHSQINCHDYGTIDPFKPIIDTVFKSIPEIDFVLIFATGGLKVRYINVKSKMDLMKELAELYVNKHNLMKQVSVLTLKKLNWSIFKNKDLTHFYITFN